MSKEKSESSKKVAVPAHIFEHMLREIMTGQLSPTLKDDLLHWSFTSPQLDQLVSELKKAELKEMIDFIETKIKTRKD